MRQWLTKYGYHKAMELGRAKANFSIAGYGNPIIASSGSSRTS